MNMEEYELRIERLVKENAKYMELFEKELDETGISAKTIQNHLSNVDTFLNDYLIYYQDAAMKDGIQHFSDFILEFYIRKCMWSTPSNVKTTAASIKKFYRCMVKSGYVGKEDYQLLCNEIKEDMEHWQEECRLFNDPDYDEFEDEWF